MKLTGRARVGLLAVLLVGLLSGGTYTFLGRAQGGPVLNEQRLTQTEFFPSTRERFVPPPVAAKAALTAGDAYNAYLNEAIPPGLEKQTSAPPVATLAVYTNDIGETPGRPPTLVWLLEFTDVPVVLYGANSKRADSGSYSARVDAVAVTSGRTTGCRELTELTFGCRRGDHVGHVGAAARTGQLVGRGVARGVGASACRQQRAADGDRYPGRAAPGRAGGTGRADRGIAVAGGGDRRADRGAAVAGGGPGRSGGAAGAAGGPGLVELQPAAQLRQSLRQEATHGHRPVAAWQVGAQARQAAWRSGDQAGAGARPGPHCGVRTRPVRRVWARPCRRAGRCRAQAAGVGGAPAAAAAGGDRVPGAGAGLRGVRGDQRGAGAGVCVGAGAVRPGGVRACRQPDGGQPRAGGAGGGAAG